VLVACEILIGETAAPERRIDLGDGRAPGRDVPPIERPEMDVLSKSFEDVAQLTVCQSMSTSTPASLTNDSIRHPSCRV